MKAFARLAVATAAIVAGAGCLQAGQAADDPAAARALLRDVVSPPPLTPEVRKRVEGLLADLASPTFKVREAASAELLRIGPAAEPFVRQAARSDHPEVAARARHLLTACQAARCDRCELLTAAIDLLAGEKDKTLVDSLVVMLGHEDEGTRRVAACGLRRVTAMQFGYSAHAPADERRAAAARWAAWWRAHRAEFDFAAASSRLAVGGVLSWNTVTQEVFLVGLDGREAWSRRIGRRVHCADLLPNGHLLVGSYENGQGLLEEYDRQDKVVWRAEGLDLKRPSAAERLPDGHTLVVDSLASVLEIDATGRKVVWHHQPRTTVFAAQRLANGNTFVCLSTGFYEVTPAGKAVGANGSLGSLRHAQKLPNGNVLLVSLSGSCVVEITPSGKDVWHWAGGTDRRPVSALRLPDGRAVIQLFRAGLILVDRASADKPLGAADKQRSWSCYPKIRLAPAQGAEGASPKSVP